MTWLHLLGCVWLRYEPVLTPTRPPPPEVDPRTLLAAQIERGLVVRSGGAPVAASALPEAVAWAGWLYATRRARGGEYDLVVDSMNVELVRDRAGRTDMRWAERAPAAVETAVAGLPFIDGTTTWTDGEKGLVSHAIQQLDPSLTPWFSDMVLWRGAVSEQHPKTQLSWYDPRTAPPRIELFDQAFEDESVGFAGAPDAPVGIAATTVLHELGHAVADAQARRAYARYLGVFTSGGDTRASWRAFLAAERADPVIESFRSVWDPPGPTRYAGRRIREAFAESFFLYFADRDALERVQPRVASWFAEGGPLRALTESD